MSSGTASVPGRAWPWASRRAFSCWTESAMLRKFIPGGSDTIGPASTTSTSSSGRASVSSRTDAAPPGPLPTTSTSGSGMGSPFAEQSAEQLVLARHHVPAADRVGVGVALPLAGHVAGVVCGAKDVDDRRVVDGGLVAVFVDAVELGVDVD